MKYNTDKRNNLFTTTNSFAKITLVLVFLLSISKLSMAEDEPLKNFRFGMRITPALTWFKPEDSKKFSSAGVKVKLGYALMTEFKLSNVVALATGIGFEKDGGSINFKDSALFK